MLGTGCSFPLISFSFRLSCRLAPVHNREYEYGLLTTEFSERLYAIEKASLIDV